MGIMSDIADVLGDKPVEVASQAAPVVNEVAIAAADSFLPVAALQHLIDYVHTFTGLNWWASIVLTTVLIRTLQLPVSIKQFKTKTKLELLVPRIALIRDEMKNRSISFDEGMARLEELVKENGLSPFTPIQGVVVFVAVFSCFFLAINNMAGKVQSFKEGGVLLFTDLTTPDPLCILPVLTALTVWIKLENRKPVRTEEDLPTAPRIADVFRKVIAALVIPLTATFPKAMFCYWITSNLYSLAFELATKNPEVRKMLGIPATQAVNREEGKRRR